MFKKFSSTIQHYLNYTVKNRYIRTAFPFFLFMGIGLVVIRECATVRYEFRKVSRVDKEELKRLGFKVRDVPKTLEETFEEYQKEVDIDNWENIRGPRLWDETPSN